MTAPEKNSNHLVTSGPVNLRQALREKLPTPRFNPLALQRLKKTRALQTLGVSLEQQFQSRPAGGPGPGAAGVLAAVLAAAGAVGILLALLQSSVPFALAGAASLAGAAAAVVRAARREPGQPAPENPVFDAASLRKLDAALEIVAPEVGEEVFERLLALKASLVRVGALLHGATADENFTVDDRLYVVECVRRYLPDSLHAYLQVPASRRESNLLEGGTSPMKVLQDQLSMLQSELDTREDKLGRSAAEHLMRQQRFLKSKTRD